MSVAEAALLASLAVALGKMGWDNLKEISSVKDRLSSLEAGTAILLSDAGHDPDAIMGVEKPLQTDGQGETNDESDK